MAENNALQDAIQELQKDGTLPFAARFMHACHFV
jgi:hypothetical protein